MESDTKIDIELASNEEESGETNNLIEDPLKMFRVSAKIVNETDEYTEELFKLLIDKKEDEFIKFSTNVNQYNSPKLNCTVGNTTYLQYACRHGLQKVAKYLIDSGADLSAVGNNYTYPPILEAIKWRSLDIATYIFEVDPKQVFMYDFSNCYNILHFISHYLPPSDDALKFLKHVLRVSGGVKEASFLLDDENIDGKTPLHIAVDNGFDKAIIVFLENGVDMFRKTKRGECEFLNVAPNIIEEYFDRKVTKDLIKKHNKIEFDYTSIVPPECFEYDNLSEETSRIVHLSEFPDFRHLIKHPVVSTFIHLKWQKVKRIFHLSLLNYVIFCILFTIHVLIYKTKSVDVFDSYEILLLFSFTILLTKVIYQFYSFRLKYLSQLDNWIEIILAVTGLLSLGFRNQQISAVAVFFTWTELILLMGLYPNLSTQVEMYKRVSITFFKFLACYSIFIIAFALNFYILFRDSKPESPPVTQTFLNVTITIYDTLVRFVDFKSETMRVDDHPVIGHIFVLMFLLLIVVIMLNLLNGLAVNVTHTIIDEAELVGLLSRLKFIHHVEYLCLIRNTLKTKFMSRIKVFNYSKTNKGNGKLVVSGDEMIRTILKAAIQIKRKRSWGTTEDKLQTLLDRVGVIEKQNKFLCATWKSHLDRTDNTILTTCAVSDR